MDKNILGNISERLKPAAPGEKFFIETPVILWYACNSYQYIEKGR